ncbi:hypothetical protein IG631_02662 [Alternaria alternata]|nr:hypothetical protein IG631_02662 [Alternaria alternata]
MLERGAAYAASMLGCGPTGMLTVRDHGRCGLRLGQLANLPIAAYEVATVR